MQKKFSSELACCDKSIDYDRNELVLGLSIIGCNSGLVYLKLKDFDKAVWALEEALNNQLLMLDETDTLVMTLLDNLPFANLLRMKHVIKEMNLKEWNALSACYKKS